MKSRGVGILIAGLVVLGAAAVIAVSVTGDGSGGMSDDPDVVEVHMTSRQFAFAPAEIRVQQDDRVRLYITSTDVMHGIGIEEFGIYRQTPPGETTVIEFTANRVGEFSFYCTVFCGTGHPDHRGMLIVEDGDP